MSNVAMIELLSGQVKAINMHSFWDNCFNVNELFWPSLAK